MDDTHTVGITYHVTLVDPQQPMLTNAQDIARLAWVNPAEIGRYLDQDDHDYQAITHGYARLMKEPSPFHLRRDLSTVKLEIDLDDLWQIFSLLATNG